MKERALRLHLLRFLDGRDAHVDWEGAFEGLPAKLRGSKPRGASHTPWEILEHLRIAQWDILEFSRNPKHRSPEWPEGYWPKTAAPPAASTWRKSLQAFGRDLRAMKNLVRNPRTDLLARIPHGTGQTILREAMLLADHNAYHLGEMVLLRRLLRAWPAR